MPKYRLPSLIALSTGPRLLSVAVLSLSLIGTACGGPSYVNKDDKHSTASLLPSVKDFPDPDGLDVEKGDPSDWKYVEPERDGLGYVRLSVGDPFAGGNRHGIADGAITIKNSNAETLATKRIISGQANYELEFDVTKGARIFVMVQATKGKATYRLTFEVRDSGPDPCADCSEDEVCKERMCVDAIKPPASVPCDPSCGRGYFCLKGRGSRAPKCLKRKSASGVCPSECERIYDVTRRFLKINFGDNKKVYAKKLARYKAQRSAGLGKCSSKCSNGSYDLSCLSGISTAGKIPSCQVPCGGQCRRGFRCDEESDSCVRAGGKCKTCSGVSCAAGKKCRCGKCRKIRVKIEAKPACDPACKSGYKCNKSSGKCIVKLGPIGCNIIQVTPAGAKTHLLLSRGRAHKVAVGDKGSVSGVGTFRIKKVFPRRSKATINKPSSALAGKKKCSINRKGWKP